jgi:hypothetical protein
MKLPFNEWATQLLAAVRDDLPEAKPSGSNLKYEITYGGRVVKITDDGIGHVSVVGTDALGAKARALFEPVLEVHSPDSLFAGPAGLIAVFLQNGITADDIRGFQGKNVLVTFREGTKHYDATGTLSLTDDGILALSDDPYNIAHLSMVEEV